MDGKRGWEITTLKNAKIVSVIVGADGKTGVEVEI